MKSLRKQLPSLTALTVFEAASRLSSFTRAAEELGVTQAAVSRQIHLLEKDFGFALFMRLHRKVALTDKGKALSAATSDAFNLIAEAVTDLRKDAPGDELTISATVAFSHFWLMPRISEFSRQYPYINLRILSQDNMPNLQLGEADVAIRFGNGMWPDAHAELLFEDEVFPVCSPKYIGVDGRIKTPADLTSYSLISNETDDPTWTGWNEWLSSFSIVVPKKTLGLRCSFYTEAIYAALNGQGIALGWTHLVEDLLQQGRLVRLTDAAIKPRGAYFVVVPTRQRSKETANLFVNWLQIVLQEPGPQTL
ncbi:LysR substrate-binding domain-containing protein [Phyllobacterium bourgognense]|uniref:DNA-binding transcriptional LysR family regulator n=1 Tax=Phyllobacterium bourgognense TaxID=314236 RepID=A0A368YMV4_9HYPH|nr:LysR substrate-binding domain-containing protein [Phyllobacterium bourgognense]RCW81552.1 DNA-binding transcriptional LysR family regulator [Phyllobacterium bourgognense]